MIFFFQANKMTNKRVTIFFLFFKHFTFFPLKNYGRSLSSIAYMSFKERLVDNNQGPIINKSQCLVAFFKQDLLFIFIFSINNIKSFDSVNGCFFGEKRKTKQIQEKK